MRLAGRSYPEISSSLGIPKSTLSYWLNKLPISDRLRKRIKNRGRAKSTTALIRRNKAQTISAVLRSSQIKAEAKRDISSISKNELLLVGTALYWAEGYKRPKLRNGRPVTYHPVSLTNSDPKLINIFLLFLRQTCRVSENQIRASIRYFSHQDPEKILRFWSKSTNIPREILENPF